MATYKVIQDIEAEDKLLGPLTLRQFIYAGITAVCLYLSFLVATRGAPVLLIVFMPVALICGFFAFPWKQDQPTEVWALARVRFRLKPHKRIWNQSGVKELVTITAPKKVEVNYTNGLSQNEVTSRLRALADTIDTRGWAIKNVNVNLYSRPQPSSAVIANSDRLVGPSGLPQDVSAVDVQAADDILDEQSNPIAQHFDQMIHASSASHRQQISDQLKQQALNNAQTPPANNYWFLNQPRTQNSGSTGYATFKPAVVSPQGDDHVGSTSSNDEEQALSKQLHELHDKNRQSYIAYSHLHTIKPLSEQAKKAVKNGSQKQSAQNAKAPVTATPNPAIVELASDNDKNVATLARLAKQKSDANSSPNEVVISLH